MHIVVIKEWTATIFRRWFLNNTQLVLSSPKCANKISLTPLCCFCKIPTLLFETHSRNWDSWDQVFPIFYCNKGYFSLVKTRPFSVV